VESRADPGYTLSASGNSSASPQGFVTEELSPIQGPMHISPVRDPG
jgi:hypothetical protein